MNMKEDIGYCLVASWQRNKLKGFFGKNNAYYAKIETL